MNEGCGSAMSFFPYSSCRRVFQSVFVHHLSLSLLPAHLSPPLPPTPPHTPSMPRMCVHKPPPLPSILPTTRLSRSETQPSYSGVENPNRRVSQRVREDSAIGYSLCMPLRQLLSKTHPDSRLSLAVSSASLKHHTLGLRVLLEERLRT